MLKKIIQNKYFIFFCRLILGLTFIYASWSKIMNPSGFADILYNYKLLPMWFIYLPALLLPWIELISGLFLISGIFVKTSAKLLTSLLIFFIIIILINLFRGINFDCGCFSSVKTISGDNPYFLIVRDILLLIPGFAIILNKERKKGEKNEC